MQARKDKQRDFPKAKAWYADQEDPARVLQARIHQHSTGIVLR